MSKLRYNFELGQISPSLLFYLFKSSAYSSTLFSAAHPFLYFFYRCFCSWSASSFSSSWFPVRYYICNAILSFTLYTAHLLTISSSHSSFISIFVLQEFSLFNLFDPIIVFKMFLCALYRFSSFFSAIDHVFIMNIIVGLMIVLYILILVFIVNTLLFNIFQLL